MESLRWILALAFSAMSGALLVGYLTTKPLAMSRYLAATLASLTAAGASIWSLGDGPPRLLLAGICLCATLFTYWLAAKRVLSREDPRVVPDLVRAEGDRGQGHTAVIYLTHGEPETYDPIGWINQFREFDELGTRFIPFLVRPLFLHLLRDKYLAVGRSDHGRMHRRMLASLERAYRESGDQDTRFYLAFLDDAPRPDAAVIRALNEGASQLVISEVFVSISNHTAEGEELIESVAPERFAVVLRAGPLWDSAILHAMFVDRASKAIGDTDRSRVGVLLIGHGQPPEWDALWPTETAQEIRFREQILDLFEAHGYRRSLLGMAWMEFREPKPAQRVEELVAQGATTILYFAAAISAAAIHSEYDVPALVARARVPDHVRLINLGAWNDDPIVIQAIKAKIDGQLDRLRS